MLTTTVILKDISYVKIVFSLIDSFSKFSGLRVDASKCEIAGMGALKNINVALCGMKNIDLTKETVNNYLRCTYFL